MADDKKPGFFKKLFGFGAKQAEPQPAPAPESVIETAPLIDESTTRIAAEIESARREAAENEAQRIAQAAAEQEQRALEQAALAAEVERQRAEKAAQDKAAKEKAALDKATQEKEAQKKEAQEKASREKAEAARKSAEKAEAEKIATERVVAERLAAETTARLKQEVEEQEAERLAAKAAQEAAAARAAIPEPEPAPVPVPISIPAPAEIPAPAPKTSWWQKLKSGLARTAGGMSEGITSLFTKRKLDSATLEDLEDILIQADLGIDVAARIAAAVGKGRYDKEIEPEEVKAILAEEVAKVLAPVAQPLVIDASKKPFVLLMIGVNGSGKTTTIGKLASKFRAEGKSVILAAGDTFRAAAIEQLKIWGERTGAPVISREQGADAAGLAFDALKAAREQNADILLIDTAGRLQNRTELMAELEKVVRVLKKMDESAPHGVLLVLDATVGQNALSQVEIFGKTAGVTGLVMTKLDGTARGGILVAIAEKFRMPVHFIGVGEGIDDLEPFAAQDFARAIAGLDQAAP
jgi:fused signal recognition particle receptor